jgi:hypothetical protein
MRRGEALAGRRTGRRPPQRRVKDKGKGEQLLEGATKTGQSRVVDLDAGTVAALRAYRAVRGSVALDLVRDTAPVLGTSTAGTVTPSGSPASSSTMSPRRARQWGRGCRR